MASINGFPVDAFLTEGHAYTNEITDDPAEDGSDLNDDIINKPIVIDVDGLISDSPIGAIVAQRSQKGDLPSDDALAALLIVYFSRNTISIETSLQVYNNMGLVSLTVPVDKSTGRALRFKAQFKQLTIVENERTSVRVASPTGSKKVALGNKALANDTALEDHLKNISDGVIDSVSRYPKGSPQRRVADMLGFGNALKGQNPFNSSLP